MYAKIMTLLRQLLLLHIRVYYHWHGIWFISDLSNIQAIACKLNCYYFYYHYYDFFPEIKATLANIYWIWKWLVFLSFVGQTINFYWIASIWLFDLSIVSRPMICMQCGNLFLWGYVIQLLIIRKKIQYSDYIIIAPN